MRFRTADLHPHGWEPGGTLQVPDWSGWPTEYLPVPRRRRLVVARPQLGPAQTPNPLRRWEPPVPYWARDP
jgi:hypothetical protein